MQSTSSPWTTKHSGVMRYNTGYNTHGNNKNKTFSCCEGKSGSETHSRGTTNADFSLTYACEVLPFVPSSEAEQVLFKMCLHTLFFR